MLTPAHIGSLGRVAEVPQGRVPCAQVISLPPPDI